MPDRLTPSEQDPLDVEPTDNSTGDLVDVERVEEVEARTRAAAEPTTD